MGLAQIRYSEDRSNIDKKNTVKKVAVKKEAVVKIAANGKTALKSKKLSLKKINDLVVDHRDHGRRLAWSFLSSWRIRMPQDEVISVVGAALCEAAHRFDPSREVAFKTFFFYHLRGMLLKEVSRMIDDQKLMHLNYGSSDTEQAMSASWDYQLVENDNPEKIIEKREISMACWRASQHLDDLEKDVLMRYFVNDEALIDIANTLNYCRCHISRVKSRALIKLSKHLSEELGKDIADLKHLRIPKKSEVARAFSASYKGGRGRRKRAA